MIGAILGVLEHGLSIWDSKEGKEIYATYLDAKQRWNEEMDKKAAGRVYSRYAIDRSLRVINDQADAYLKFIRTGK